MEFDKLQFNASRAHFRLASDIIALIIQRADGSYVLKFKGAGRHTITSNHKLRYENLSDKDVETIVNEVENNI